MKPGIGMKIRACADLIRMDLALGAGFFAVAGEILAVGGVPPPDQAVLGFLTLFFISGSANISNDYFDREVDRVNLPSRPLPSGRIPVTELWVLFAVFTAAGFAAAALLSPPVLALVLVLWAVSNAYNLKLKEYGFIGNLVVAGCLAMIFIVAGIIAGEINGVVITFAALAFFFDLGEEIAGDALDVKGDQLRPSRSIAKRWGRSRAMTVAGIMYLIFFTLTTVPFLAGWLSYDYLLLVLIMDLFMIWCVMTLVSSTVIEEGRRQMVRLYMAWGIFVIAVAAIRIL